MPEKQYGKPPRTATPEEYPVSSSAPSLPSGDYSYVLEIAMRSQDTLGQLKEAVGSLKEQFKRHDDKLDEIGKDVHAAKVSMRVLVGVILAIAGLVAWIVNTYISAHAAKP